MPASGSTPRVFDGAPVAMLSHAFWRRRYGASSAIIGSPMRINGRPYTVVGVAEPSFEGTTIVGADMWMPFAMAPHISGRETMELLTSHRAVWHLGIARLKHGVTLTQARDELNGLLAPLKASHPETYAGWSIALLPSARLPGEFRAAVGGFVGILLALTLLVLAIACSNVRECCWRGPWSGAASWRRVSRLGPRADSSWGSS